MEESDFEQYIMKVRRHRSETLEQDAIFANRLI
jgi:hypothetical protein